jgi:hypothetical protein
VSTLCPSTQEHVFFTFNIELVIFITFLNATIWHVELGYLSGIALGYGLNGRGGRVPVGVGNFSPTEPPTQRVTGALSLGVKRPGREADHSPPSSADVKNAWRYTSTPSIHLYGVMLS